MKINQLRTRILACCCMLLISLTGFSQGKVVINEYMPWPSGTCGTTSEFVELLNFGPGPVNIGCYILTNGKYSITIPANTILQPGQYYLMAGVDVLPVGCGNVDSAVHARLNWNTCNCTNTPIPTTGDGFMTDGGGANVNLALLDPDLTIIDAVTRSMPVDASTTITSKATGVCTGKTFDLNTLNPTYETLGMSTGKSNSFARKLDGACEWVKQPAISANATNNTSGSTSGITYAFNIVRSMDLCDGQGGSISIQVQGSNVASYFPMNYTLAYDADKNGVFDFSDTYTFGSDNTPSSIDITNLAAGRYTITVGSAQGCNLKSFSFSILPCQGVLDLQLLYFKLVSSTSGISTFDWKLTETENLLHWALEASSDGINYAIAAEGEAKSPAFGTQQFQQSIASSQTFFRLCLTNKEGKKTYSSVINTKNAVQVAAFGPNPAQERLNLSLSAKGFSLMQYAIVGSNGIISQKGQWSLHAGLNPLTVPLQSLVPGIYQLVLTSSEKGAQPISFRFVKQ